MLCVAWSQMRGKPTKSAFTTSWLVPRAGSPLPASAPRSSSSRQSRSRTDGLGSHLCSEIWPSGMWGDEKDRGRSSWSNYTRTLAMKIKPDPCWRLKSFVRFPSCFLFHSLCFVCLILWLHGYCGIGSKEIPQKKVKRACGVPDGAKPKKHWKYPPPARGCEISSPIARPERFGVMCGPPPCKPLPNFCLLFHSSVSNIDFLG